MFAGSSDDSDSSIESECCFKAIDALKKASRKNGLLFGTLIFKEDGTLKYKLEEKKHNKYELYVTLKGPIGTPYEVIFVFDLNNFLLTNLFTHLFSEYFK